MLNTVFWSKWVKRQKQEEDGDKWEERKNRCARTEQNRFIWVGISWSWKVELKKYAGEPERWSSVASTE